MENKKELITILISQHRTLQREVEIVASFLKNEPIDIEKIKQGLEQFKSDLVIHLKLENDAFYTELLKDMKAKGQNTDKTEMFIEEMKDIEKVVVAFLEKYSTVESIKGKLEDLKKEFLGIVDVLNIRIESEEAGVYNYWQLA